MNDRQLRASRRDIFKGAMAGVSLALPLGPAGAMTAGSPDKDWWKKEYRILQTNLREIDARQDPATIARDVRAFGANTLVSNVGGIVAFYPTRLPLHFRNRHMKGDFAGKMIAAAHREGLSFVGRFDLSKAMKPVYDAHPDWFMRNRDGSAREYAGSYQACPNGGWAQDYALRIIEEALRLYPLDGLFFNMVGYTRTDYSNVDHGICVCRNCSGRFRELYGLDLPASDGPDDPDWQAYVAFQRRTQSELSKRTITLVRQLRPDAALMDFGVGEIARGEVQRRVDRPAPEWPYAMGEQIRWIKSVAPGRPFSATSTAHIDYPWRETTETAANHMLRFAQALGTGGKLDLYLIGTLSDQVDQSWLKPVSELYHWHEANEQFYAGLRPASRVGLLGPNVELTGGKESVSEAHRGAYLALVNLRIPFLYVDRGRLARQGAAVLDGIDVLLAPDARKLSDEQARVLDAFVARGGLLIATGKTGSLDEAGKSRDIPALASSPVAAFGAEEPAHGWSLAGDASLYGGGRIPLDGTYFASTARGDARNLISFAPDHPFGPPEFAYPAAGEPVRSAPGVLARPFGKGLSVHIPWQPDLLYYRQGLAAHRDLLGALIVHHAPPAFVRLEGNGAVELTIERQGQSGTWMVHVINYAGQRQGDYSEPPTLHGLRLGLRDPTLASARALRAGVMITGQPGGDGYMWFDLPPVKHFEAIRIS
ncbi:hypothetical protein ACFB49_22600 [Sphingomonas sp. DBB INV C78]|uniref:alpha-amylase family protein n=1 Tax=Sphingomonas sp. DBB INV C78 TaxID=3349434 RepID=UPI0036D2C1B1